MASRRKKTAVTSLSKLKQSNLLASLSKCDGKEGKAAFDPYEFEGSQSLEVEVPAKRPRLSLEKTNSSTTLTKAKKCTKTQKKKSPAHADTQAQQRELQEDTDLQRALKASLSTKTARPKKRRKKSSPKEMDLDSQQIEEKVEKMQRDIEKAKRIIDTAKSLDETNIAALWTSSAAPQSDGDVTVVDLTCNNTTGEGGGGGGGGVVCNSPPTVGVVCNDPPPMGAVCDDPPSSGPDLTISPPLTSPVPRTRYEEGGEEKVNDIIMVTTPPGTDRAGVSPSLSPQLKTVSVKKLSMKKLGASKITYSKTSGRAKLTTPPSFEQRATDCNGADSALIVPSQQNKVPSQQNIEDKDANATGDLTPVVAVVDSVAIDDSRLRGAEEATEVGHTSQRDSGTTPSLSKNREALRRKRRRRLQRGGKGALSQTVDTLNNSGEPVTPPLHRTHPPGSQDCEARLPVSDCKKTAEARRNLSLSYSKKRSTPKNQTVFSRDKPKTLCDETIEIFPLESQHPVVIRSPAVSSSPAVPKNRHEAGNTPLSAIPNIPTEEEEEEEVVVKKVTSASIMDDAVIARKQKREREEQEEEPIETAANNSGSQSARVSKNVLDSLQPQASVSPSPRQQTQSGRGTRQKLTPKTPSIKLPRIRTESAQRTAPDPSASRTKHEQRTVLDSKTSRNKDTEGLVSDPRTKATQRSVFDQQASRTRDTESPVSDPKAKSTQRSVLDFKAARTIRPVLDPKSAGTKDTVLDPKSARTKDTVLDPKSTRTKDTVFDPKSTRTKDTDLDPKSARTMDTQRAPQAARPCVLQPRPLLYCPGEGEVSPASYTKIIVHSFNSYFSRLAEAQSRQPLRVSWGEPVRSSPRQPFTSLLFSAGGARKTRSRPSNMEDRLSLRMVPPSAADSSTGEWQQQQLQIDRDTPPAADELQEDEASVGDGQAMAVSLLSGGAGEEDPVLGLCDLSVRSLHDTDHASERNDYSSDSEADVVAGPLRLLDTGQDDEEDVLQGEAELLVREEGCGFSDHCGEEAGERGGGYSNGGSETIVINTTQNSIRPHLAPSASPVQDLIIIGTQDGNRTTELSQQRSTTPTTTTPTTTTATFNRLTPSLSPSPSDEEQTPRGAAATRGEGKTSARRREVEAASPWLSSRKPPPPSARRLAGSAGRKTPIRAKKSQLAGSRTPKNTVRQSKRGSSSSSKRVVGRGKGKGTAAAWLIRNAVESNGGEEGSSESNGGEEGSPESAGGDGGGGVVVGGGALSPSSARRLGTLSEESNEEEEEEVFASVKRKARGKQRIVPEDTSEEEDGGKDDFSSSFVRGRAANQATRKKSSSVIDLTEELLKGEAGRRSPAGVGMAAKHPCPVCHRMFGESAIDAHVNRCLNMEGGGVSSDRAEEEEEEEEDRMPARRRQLFTSVGATKGAGQAAASKKTHQRQLTLKALESTSPSPANNVIDLDDPNTPPPPLVSRPGNASSSSPMAYMTDDNDDNDSDDDRVLEQPQAMRCEDGGYLIDPSTISNSPIRTFTRIDDLGPRERDSFRNQFQSKARKKRAPSSSSSARGSKTSLLPTHRTMGRWTGRDDFDELLGRSGQKKGRKSYGQKKVYKWNRGSRKKK